MVVLTITATKNPITVFFEKTIPEAKSVSLLSCTLPNSWYNLKNKGEIFLKNDINKILLIIELPPGHYTEKILKKKIDEKVETTIIKIPIELNSPFGQMEINKEKIQTLEFNEPLTNFLRLPKSSFSFNHIIVKKFASPDKYFVYCDLVDSERNLENGKRSKLISIFDIKGNPFENVYYKNDAIFRQREASTGQHVNSVTLEVKDENGKLFDFRGEKINFVLRID